MLPVMSNNVTTECIVYICIVADPLVLLGIILNISHNTVLVFQNKPRVGATVILYYMPSRRRFNFENVKNTNHYYLICTLVRTTKREKKNLQLWWWKVTIKTEIIFLFANDSGINPQHWKEEKVWKKKALEKYFLKW